MHDDTGGRISRLEAIHLTLAFLGEVREIPALQIQGRKHQLPIEQARYWKHNQIVWVGPRETPKALLEIATALKTEERGFAAHITLIRKARAPSSLPQLPAVDWPVSEVTLVRSHLSSKGSSYEVLQRYPLS